MTAWQYSPDDQELNVGGVPISGFARETFIKITQLEETGATREGVGGEVTFIHKKSKRYMIEFILEYGSASNDYLSALYWSNQKIPGSGVVPVIEKDGLGREFFTSAEGLIKKLPDTGKGNDQGDTKTWQMECVVEPGGFFPGGL